MKLLQAGQERLLVAEDDGEVIGFAGYGTNTDDLPDNIGELNGLYVDPDAWDRGIGTALIERAQQGLVGAGYIRAILWTSEANTRTRRFYEHRGWAFDGATKPHHSGAMLVRYRCDLQDRQRMGSG